MVFFFFWKRIVVRIAKLNENYKETLDIGNIHDGVANFTGGIGNLMKIDDHVKPHISRRT